MEENDPLAQVFSLSRVVGLAPYDSLQRLRVSRRVFIYSVILHLAVGIIVLSAYAMQLAKMDKLDYNVIFWMAINVFLEMILWVEVVNGPNKLRKCLYLLTRVKKVCRDIQYNNAANSWQRKISWIFILVEVLQSITVILAIQTTLAYAKQDNGTVLFACGWVLGDVNYFFLLLLTMQFVTISIKINSALRGVNEGLQYLCAQLRPAADPEKNAKNNLIIPKNMPAVQFINVKPKTVAAVYHYSAHLTLRSFANAYVSTCDIARSMGDASGGFLFLFVTYSFLNLLDGIFYALNKSDLVIGTCLNNLFLFSKTAINCFLYISTFILLVVPCHELSEQLETTRCLVSRISCEGSTCSEAFRAELNLFFIHLNVNQPRYTALGICTLGRPLLLTVFAVTLTYLAVLFGV